MILPGQSVTFTRDHIETYPYVVHVKAGTRGTAGAIFNGNGYVNIYHYSGEYHGSRRACGLI